MSKDTKSEYLIGIQLTLAKLRKEGNRTHAWFYLRCAVGQRQRDAYDAAHPRYEPEWRS